MPRPLVLALVSTPKHIQGVKGKSPICHNMLVLHMRRMIWHVLDVCAIHISRQKLARGQVVRA